VRPAGRVATAPSAWSPRQVQRESLTLGKAMVSSLVATGVDGIAYQAALFLAPGHCFAAAFVAALAGAVTNFSLNRYWAFPPSGISLRRQTAYYALASAATYVGMVAALKLSMDVLLLNERVAWLPAKVLSWLLVSYPLHRLFVFSKARTLT
jgi:putative flippase GtrA